MNKKGLIFFIIIVAFFVSRFFGIGQMYHQDEYRWATIANPIFENGTAPHPPFTKYLLRVTGDLLGYDNLRFATLLFGFFNLLLVYQIIKKIAPGAKAALIGSFLYVISVYSAIANLQIDIDGAFLPFFVLLTYYAYLRIPNRKGLMWSVIFTAGIIGGFLTKESFVLFLGALAIDYSLSIYESQGFNLKKFTLKIAKFVGPIVLIGLAFYYLYLSRSEYMIEYLRHFNSLNFGSRAYFELGFKILKSFVWLSPLLLLPVIGGLFDREIIRKYRFWYLYLVISTIFYLVLFDFTTLTVERYFMFWIIPSIIISSEIILRMIDGIEFRKNYLKYISAGSLFIGISFFILSATSVVLPLNPKEAYVNHIKSLDFNFLLPLTDGSGPIGFYFSAQFILWMWLSGIFLLGGALFFRKARIYLGIIFVIFGVGYNLIFLNEYLFGTLFCSVPTVARASVDYVRDNPNIGSVITYYDIGAYYLRLADKYEARFYTAPSRDYTVRMNAYRGYYMIVDFPAIDKQGKYWSFFENCRLEKKFVDKYVESYIFDCSDKTIRKNTQ